MKFEVNTTMDRKTMTAMAKAARKVMRRKRSLFVRVFGGIAAAMAVFLGLARFGGGDVNGWIDIALGLVLLAFILLEDAMNGAFARTAMSMWSVPPRGAGPTTRFRPSARRRTTLFCCWASGRGRSTTRRASWRVLRRNFAALSAKRPASQYSISNKDRTV